jgi:hypothetical protein
VRRFKHYILRNKVAVPVELKEWSRSFEKENRFVGRDIVGFFEVSTVFLGLDHNFSEEGPPLLFETMVFSIQDNGESDYAGEEQWRCSTWEEAEAQHKMAMELIYASMKVNGP